MVDDLLLEGVRVLDLTRLLPGPFCTMLLADMGADVIKVEDTRGGDYARYYPPRLGEHGALFASVNRNKRGLAVDLKTPQGADALRRLVTTADVLIESFRPGVMDRLGLGKDALMALNPRLIYCAITGYGQSGPLKHRAGHDLNYLGYAGVLELNGAADADPVPPGHQLADIAGGALYAALGVSAALFRRERTGQGTFLDISMTEGALSFNIPTMASVAAGATPRRGQEFLSGGVPCYGVYATSDGRHLAVGSLEPKFWMALVQTLGMPELAMDNLTSGEEGARVRARLADAFAQKTLDQWLAIFADVDACVEPVLRPDEVFQEPLFVARKMFFELQGATYTRPPLTPPERQHSVAPNHGEHTDEILAEAGFSATEIAQLRDARAVR